MRFFYLSLELYGLNHDAAQKFKENTGIFFQKVKRCDQQNAK